MFTGLLFFPETKKKMSLLQQLSRAEGPNPEGLSLPISFAVHPSAQQHCEHLPGCLLMEPGGWRIRPPAEEPLLLEGSGKVAV